MHGRILLYLFFISLVLLYFVFLRGNDSSYKAYGFQRQQMGLKLMLSCVISPLQASVFSFYKAGWDSNRACSIGLRWALHSVHVQGSDQAGCPMSGLTPVTSLSHFCSEQGNKNMGELAISLSPIALSSVPLRTGPFSFPIKWQARRTNKPASQSLSFPSFFPCLSGRYFLSQD